MSGGVYTTKWEVYSVVGNGQAVEVAALDWRSVVIMDALGKLQQFYLDLPSNTWVAGEVLWT